MLRIIMIKKPLLLIFILMLQYNFVTFVSEITTKECKWSYLYVFFDVLLDESFLYKPYYNQENCIYVSFDARFVSSVVMHLAH